MPMQDYHNVNCIVSLSLSSSQNMSQNVIKAKKEWLDTTEDPTTEDFINQKLEFDEAIDPILTKLSEPCKCAIWFSTLFYY